MVVPTTGGSPTLAHIGGFSTVPSISSSSLNPSRARHDSSDGQEILKSSSYVLDKPTDIMS